MKVETVTFANGIGRVDVPDVYDVSLGHNGTLQLLERSGGAIRVYFNFHSLSELYSAPDCGVQLVAKIASERGLKGGVFEDRFIAMEPGGTTIVNEAPVVNVHWSIGFGQSMVVMTCTVVKAAMDSPQFKRFLESDFYFFVRSLQNAMQTH